MDGLLLPRSGSWEVYHITDGYFVDKRGFHDIDEKVIELVKIYATDPEILYQDPDKTLTKKEMVNLRDENVKKVLNEIAVLATKIFWPPCLQHLIAGPTSPLLKNPYNGVMSNIMKCEYSSCIL